MPMGISVTYVPPDDGRAYGRFQREAGRGGMMRGLFVVAVLVVLGAAGIAAGENGPERVLTLRGAVQMALARDALVRDAQQSLGDARAELVRASAYTPTLRTGTRSSATTTTGLDPESAVSGTDYSSRSYYSALDFPIPGGTSLGLGLSASTSTTNSALRTGEEMEFTYARASVGADVTRPLGLLRDERVLTEGDRWAAEIDVRRAELALDEARRRVVADTLDHFFGALRAQRRAEIAEASHRESEELLRIAEAKFERGKLAEIEVMEAKVSAETARVAARSARSAAETALDELRNFLGMSLEEGVRLSHEDTAVTGPPALDEDALTERALSQRADLQQLALGVRLAELSARQVEAESRPGIYLQGGYSRSGEAETIGKSFRDLVNPSWYVGISATTSLTRKEDRAEIERARGALRVSQLDEQLARDGVRLEIRRLAREAEDAAANAIVLAETVEIAEENLRIRQVQFEHGLIRSIDVTQTERQLREARAQLLDAVIDQQLAAARLCLAAGETPFPVHTRQSPGPGDARPDDSASIDAQEKRG
jgi:outer membrane protein